MLNFLYEVPIKIKPKNIDSMPSGQVGAIVNYYVTSTDYLSALKSAVKKLAQDGYVFIDVVAEIRQIDPEKWDIFIELAWSDMVEYLPHQEEIIEIIKVGGVIYGPFISYESED